MTANGQWKVIKKQLHRGETYHDRPDIVTRVFCQKYKELIDDIEKKHIFGVAKSIVYTIEFQKRGIPHVHILVIIERQDRPILEQIDSFVCAEIPDPSKFSSGDPNNPGLYENVTMFNLHGPCTSACLEDELCNKGFPKTFMPHTVGGEDGYPKYRRREPKDGGYTVKKFSRGVERVVNNSYVIPYNPFLTQKFECHINIEYCASIASVKYLYKYTHKGTDQSSIYLNDEGDGVIDNEIDQFVNMRKLRNSG